MSDVQGVSATGDFYYNGEYTTRGTSAIPSGRTVHTFYPPVNYMVTDTDLTSVADAIRTKGGTAADLEFPDGFVSAVQAIPSGITPTGNINITTTGQTDVTNYATAQVVDADLVAGNIKKDVNVLGVVGTYDGDREDLFNYVQSINATFAYATLPDEMTLNLSSYKGYSQGYTFYRTNPYYGSYNCRTKVTLNFPSPKLNNFSLNNIFYQAYGIKEVKITGDLSGVTSYNSFIDFCFSLEVLDGEIDFTSCTNARSFASNADNNVLTTLTFKENSLGVIIHLKGLAALNDASIVSIANSIKDGTAATLTLHATPKARCSTLMGTVALDPTSTFHVFTADPSGTVTLADFITNTKGWTLA